MSIVEEQEIYREMYRYILPSKANIVISKISDYQSRGDIDAAIAEACPDVLLLSVKKLDINMIEELERIRSGHPEMGIVITLRVWKT